MRKLTWILSALLCVSVASQVEGREGEDENAGKREEKRTYRGLLGKGNPKIKREGDKVFICASRNVRGPNVEWYDFTGSPIPPEELQFGIGRDSIPAIDDPVFVEPDDPRLMGIRTSPYRRDEKPETPDDIMVIGYVVGEEAKAYPTALLDGHELVNDLIGGKPFTVGW